MTLIAFCLSTFKGECSFTYDHFRNLISPRTCSGQRSPPGVWFQCVHTFSYEAFGQEPEVGITQWIKRERSRLSHPLSFMYLLITPHPRPPRPPPLTLTHTLLKTMALWPGDKQLHNPTHPSPGLRSVV